MTTATITWTNPTIHMDGSPLDPSQIATVDIYEVVGEQPTPIGNVVGGHQHFTTGPLSGGAHVFLVVANDTSGRKSLPISASIIVSGAPSSPSSQPGPVSDVAVTLNP